jgi:energy-coupling factor transporter ATP-binding protein EcfA2
VTESSDAQLELPKGANPCRAWISSLRFCDGTTLDLHQSDIVVLVGANNGGKSETLNAIETLAKTGKSQSPVVQSLSIKKSGTPELLLDWMKLNCARVGEFPNIRYTGFGMDMPDATAVSQWASDALLGLTPVFLHSCRTQSRITDSNNANAIAPHESKSHPLHRLYDDSDLESKVSAPFRHAFGKDLVINWRGGSQIPVHVGIRPVRTAEADRVSNEYCEAVKKLPLLSSQGDGMRSFASLLFALEALDASILLIDEPEAFLHPPQAKRMGELIATARAHQRQIIVATHSTDVLRGILSIDSANTKIVRLSRDGGQGTKVLEPTAIEKLWSDPILRFSNALDGLFHEATVLCEGDADCRFYEAMAAVIAPSSGDWSVDLHFAYTSGKDRLPVVQRALRTLGVKVLVIADFDLLQRDKPLEELLENVPGEWEAVVAAIKAIRTAIEQRSPTLPRSQLAVAISAVIGNSDKASLTDDERDEIKKLLNGTSLWRIAKTQGKTLLAGTAAQQAQALLDRLIGSDIFVVPVGEMESFCRTVGNHGPRWVTEVLKRPLKSDPDLVEARNFVNKLLNRCLV